MKRKSTFALDVYKTCASCKIPAPVSEVQATSRRISLRRRLQSAGMDSSVSFVESNAKDEYVLCIGGLNRVAIAVHPKSPTGLPVNCKIHSLGNEDNTLAIAIAPTSVILLSLKLNLSRKSSEGSAETKANRPLSVIRICSSTSSFMEGKRRSRVTSLQIW